MSTESSSAWQTLYTSGTILRYDMQKGSLHKNEHHHFTISTKYNTLNWENTAKRADIQVFEQN